MKKVTQNDSENVSDYERVVEQLSIARRVTAENAKYTLGVEQDRRELIEVIKQLGDCRVWCMGDGCDICRVKKDVDKIRRT